MRHQRTNAFTIVELLVVIGVIGVLLGLLIPAMSAVRASGRQTVELSAARQLMAAYTAYSAASRDAVLPGYLDVPKAYDGQGKLIAGGGLLDTAKKRYLWRLAPYLKYNLRGLFTNEAEELLEQLGDGNDYENYIYKTSLVPSLGLNTEWVGGDSNAYGFLPPSSPLRNVLDLNRYYITSMSQALNPRKLIVFASARGKDPDNGVSKSVEGYYKISSPYFTQLTGYRWSAEYDSNAEPLTYGYLSPRHGGKVAAAFIDGHAEVLTKDQVKDMRYWANWADTADWKLPTLSPSP